MHCDCSKAVREASAPLLGEIERLRDENAQLHEDIDLQLTKDATIPYFRAELASANALREGQRRTICEYQRKVAERDATIINLRSEIERLKAEAEELARLNPTVPMVELSELAVMHMQRDEARFELQSAKSTIADLRDQLSELEDHNRRLRQCMTAGQMQREREGLGAPRQCISSAAEIAVKERPDLQRLIDEAKIKVEALSPAERDAMWASQRESFIRAEMPCSHGNEWDKCAKCCSEIEWPAADSGLDGA